MTVTYHDTPKSSQQKTIFQWPATSLFEVASTTVGHQRSHRPALGILAALLGMGTRLWAKPLPDLVAAGHPGLPLGPLRLGAPPGTGAGLRISFAKPGGRKGSSRDWVKDDQISSDIVSKSASDISLVLIPSQSVFSCQGPVVQYLNTRIHL